MSEVAQLTQISDNVNQGYIAGRDLYLGDQYAVQETLYFEPDLRDVEPPGWPTTPKAVELAEGLSKRRLIVLAGQDLDDKTMVARHLAWLLRRELTGEVRVREWYRSSDPQKIEAAFHDSATTVLLLPQILPHHIGHRLDVLARLLHKRQNYAVITTDGSKGEWEIERNSATEQLWCEVSWESYYGRAFLSDLLRHELGAKIDQIFPANLSIEDVAARLKQPDRIRQFALWLTGQAKDAPPQSVLSQVDQLGGGRQAIFHWYRQLSRIEQLLALGLALFDGLPDDQIFACLEILVNQAWRQTDPHLPLFDYHDLQRLGAYFRIVDARKDETRIEASSRQSREAVLGAAWELQRRRLLTTLPAITGMIKGLVPTDLPEAVPPQNQQAGTQASPLAEAGAYLREMFRGTRGQWRFTRGSERELYSTVERSHQLQQSVIESLSQIGLLSFEAVEACFLELAIEGSTGFKTIVAKALASWRGHGRSDQLFRVLRAWWEDGCRPSSAQALTQRVVRKGTDPFVAMRATVALAAGYSVQYDPPNRLASELVSLLEVLARDRNAGVRRTFLELTLPIAVASHLNQLEGLLRLRIVLDEDQMYATAFGVAMAYSLRPDEALDVLERWRDMVQQKNTETAAGMSVPSRERLLATVCLSYGYIRCTDGDALTPNQIISTLRSILASEKHPYIRKHALLAMGLQAVHSFELAAPMMLELISDVNLADRVYVITVFAKAYLHQRETLTGGDEKLEIAGRSFEVWTRSGRPLTAIEVSLYSWLVDDSHPVAQQVAAQTFAVLAATELERRESELLARRWREPLAQPSQTQTSSALPPMPAEPERLRKLHPLGWLALTLALPRKKELRSQLWPVMAEVIEMQQGLGAGRSYREVAASLQRKNGASGQQQAPSGPLVPTVLYKWLTVGDEAVNHLARTLGRALEIYRYRWLILSLVFISYVVSCSVVKSCVSETNKPAEGRRQSSAAPAPPAGQSTADFSISGRLGGRLRG